MKNVLTAKNQRFLRWIVAVGMLLSLLFLAYSVGVSGYKYQLDNDEYFHVQLVYLIAHGFVPFSTIYMTVYTPLFQWFLLPFFHSLGFSYDAIQFSRFVMIVLFFLRIGMVSLLIKKLWNWRAAMFVIPFMLLDPFAVFSGMQIRSDNFMLFCYTLAFLFFLFGLLRQNKPLLFGSGFMFLISFLILMKVFPGIVVTFGVFSLLMIGKKRWRDLLIFLSGGIFAVSLFSLYFLSQGTFVEMVREVFIEAIVSYKSVFEYPVPFGFFYKPNNVFVYGVGGKPLHWIFVWILITGGIGGALITAWRIVTKNHRDTRDWIRCIFALTLGAQWTFLLLLPSVFIQHYLPVHWLLAVFLAVALDGVLVFLHVHSRAFYGAIGMICFLFLLATGKQSIEANFTRSRFDMSTEKQIHEARWQIIPENEVTFPNFLFRPLVYPVPYAHFIGNIPDVILYRLPDIERTLAQKKVKYVILSDYYLAHLKPNVQEFIRTHYRLRSDDAEIYELVP